MQSMDEYYLLKNKIQEIETNEMGHCSRHIKEESCFIDWAL